MPGKPDESELIVRIESDDPELQMPPKKSGKQLTAEQVAVLRRWVEARGDVVDALGLRAAAKARAAGRQEHCAGPSPRSTGSSWPGSRARGSRPRPKPTRPTLIRRVTLDLTGLPPTLEEVDCLPGRSVLAEPMRRSSTGCSTRPATASTWPGSGSTPRATATPTACTWTTTARSGPIATGSSARSTTTSRSTGSSSSSWPATCCPIRRPTRSIATGYNRCHVSTNEGGSIEEEVYVRNIVDQVDTNGTVFLGLTTGCARCHDHKYDPIRTKDYYQLFAFFNNIDGPAMDGNSAKWAPIVQVPTVEQAAALRAVDRPDRRVQESDRGRGRQGGSAYDTKADAEREARPPSGPTSSGSTTRCPRAPRRKGTGPGISSASPTNPSYSGASPCEIAPKGSSSGSSTTPSSKLKVGAGDTLFAYVYIDPKHPPQELMLQWHTRGRLDAPRLLGRQRDRLGQGRHA